MRNQTKKLLPMQIKLNGKEMDVPDGSTVEDLLVMVNARRDAVITALNNEIVIEESQLVEGDEIKLISVVSGG